MRLPAAAAALATLVTPLATAARGEPAPAHLFANPPNTQHWPHIPSVRESTVQARRILHLQSIGTISTVFPAAPHAAGTADDGETLRTLEQRPPSVAAAPIGLMEYYASCAPSVSDPTILGVTIATSMKNADAGSNVTLSLRYILPASAPQPPPDPWAYYAANLPRFALVGHLERLSDEVVDAHNVTGCFFDTHPEARIWAPGSDIHDSWWGRLRVEEVYFFGGFGDRARIEWLPVELWHNITQEEVEKYRMVGEEGYEASAREWREKEGPMVLGMEL